MTLQGIPKMFHNAFKFNDQELHPQAITFELFLERWLQYIESVFWKLYMMVYSVVGAWPGGKWNFVPYKVIYLGYQFSTKITVTSHLFIYLAVS